MVLEDEFFAWGMALWDESAAAHFSSTHAIRAAARSMIPGKYTDPVKIAYLRKEPREATK
jgi:hypothetical protein